MNSPIAQLSDLDRTRLEQFLIEFDQNWTVHHLGIIAGQLTTESSEFKAAALAELVKIDLEHRQQHEPARVEWYLKRFPELGESSAGLSELVQAEIAVRQAAGDDPTTKELQQRFPSLREQIERLLAQVGQQDEFSAIRRAKRQDASSEPQVETSDSTTSIAAAAMETLPPKQRRSGTEDAHAGATTEFGRYRLLQELGRGAMGTVYLAEDTELRRHVALKRPRIAGTDEASLLERFYREAYAAATLDHPNICPVYDIGQHEGIPYITMAYVEGKPLSRVIRESRGLNLRSVAVLLRKIAIALAEAHAKGVIHRDLKPGNIMLNHRSEPIVMDFGLARQVEDVKDRLTTDGTLIGTPGYMSPEQVDGDLHAVGPASDIYSLGVVLFELLTGQLPFQGSVAAVIGKIVRDQPPAPSSLRADVPPQFEAICLKMMAKSSADRYATMGDVAEALGAFIKSSGETAAVSSAPPIEQLTPAQLAEQQRRLAQMIADGQWREASVQLQRMSDRQEPIAAPYAKWAKEQTAALHVRWQAEQQTAGRALVAAKEQFKQQDYAGAAQTLLAVHKQLLTAEGQQLLDESVKLQEEVDLLIHLIEQGLSGGKQAGMFKNMQRLLQLKPKDRLVRDLYRKFGWQQRLGWFGAMLADAVSLADGRTRSIHDDPLLRKWLAMAAVVFLISFGLMTWAVMSYLKDDSEIAEQSAEVAVAVDESHAEPNEISGPGVSEAEATPTMDSFDAPSITSDTQPQENEPSATVTPTSVDADRAAAEWVISNGGVVVVDIRKTLRIDKLADLPQERFRVISVIFSNKSPDATGMDALANLAQLLTVTLMGSEITDEHLRWLTKAPKFRSLGLADCDISELGLQYVSNIEGLQSLVLARTKVTDTGLIHLRNMKQLTQITLTQTAVTNGGVVELERALPKCEVVWDGRPKSTGYQRPTLPQIPQQPLSIMTHGLQIPTVVAAETVPKEWREAGVVARIRGPGIMRFPKLNVRTFAVDLDLQITSAEHLGGVHFMFGGSRPRSSNYFVRVVGKESPSRVFANLGRTIEGREVLSVPGFESAFGESVKLTLLVGEDRQLLYSEGGIRPHSQTSSDEEPTISVAVAQRAVDMTIQRFLLRALTDEDKSLLAESSQ